MELESHPFQELIERIQTLVADQSSVDRAIENILFSGYLWKANRLEDKNMVDGCYGIVCEEMAKVTRMLIKLSACRQVWTPLIAHFRRMQSLRNRQQKTLKKIELLKKLKSYQKEVLLPINNIDQAFFVERSKQKMYHHLERKSDMVEKVVIFKILKNRVHLANLNVVRLVKANLEAWIDKAVVTENKHK